MFYNLLLSIFASAIGICLLRKISLNEEENDIDEQYMPQETGYVDGSTDDECADFSCYESVDYRNNNIISV